MAAAPGFPGPSAGLVCAALLCLACLVLPALADPALQTTGDSLELADDKDFIYEDLLDHHSVVCPRPMCECRHVGSGGIAAKCSSLDFKGQRFQGVVSHFEVSGAPDFDDGLFLLHNSLASLGLQFLTTVKIANSSLKGLSLSTFEGLTDLYDVDLSNNRIMIPSQDVFLNNSLLRKLSLRGNPVGVAQMVEKGLEKSYLLNSASLNELDLSECELADLSPHVFSRMKHLERLLLAGNKLRTLHRDTLSWLTELEELDLSDNLLSALTTDMFLNSTELTELRLRGNDLRALAGVEILGLDELDVSDNLFEAIDRDTFLGFPALTRLNLSNNAILRIDRLAFEPMRHLQDLDLSGNTITGPLPRELFATCEVLETLNLSDNPSMTALPEGGFLGQFTALYQLDLSYTSLRSLADDSFVGMDHLSILNLHGNQLTEVGAGVLKRLPQLITLDLSDNHIATLDVKMFETSGFLRHLDLSGNQLTTLSPRVFAGTPYLRWLDLSQCALTSLWDSQAPSVPGTLRKVAHLNLSGNQISTLRVSDLAPASGLAVLDIANNPLKCSKELHYLMEWLIKRSVTPRLAAPTASAGLHDTAAPYDDLMHGVAEEMMEDSSLRVRWAAVYDQFCGNKAFVNERKKLLTTILASSPATAAPAPASAKKGVTQEELEDIKMVLGEKKMTVPPVDTDEDEDDDSDMGGVDPNMDDSDMGGVDPNMDEDSDEDDDEDDDNGSDEDEYDDSNLIADSNSNGTDYLAFTHRGNPYLWPVLTIGALLATTVLVVSNVVVCMVRRRRARRHARFLSPMYRQLGGLSAPGQHKTFGGIPGSFIKTKKDGGFVYKKLYEDTTTPVFVPQPQIHPAGNTFRFPLDPSDLQGPHDPQRV